MPTGTAPPPSPYRHSTDPTPLPHATRARHPTDLPTPTPDVARTRHQRTRHPTDAPPALHTPPADLFHVKPGQATNPHPGCSPKTTQSFRPRSARTPGTRPRGASPHPGQQPGPRRGRHERAGTVRLPRPGQLGGQGAPQARRDYPAAAYPRTGPGPPPPTGTVREPPPQETALCGHELTVRSVASGTIRRYDRATCEASTQQRYLIDIKRSPTCLPCLP